MKTAFIFPGQGSQNVGMGKDFYSNFRESKLAFEEASDAIHVDLKRLCFDGPMDELTLTENLQPSLFVLEAAMLAAVRVHCDVKPALVAGHSLGEYSALHAAGALSLADGATLTRRRGGAMQRAVPIGKGTMAAVMGLDNNIVDELCCKAAASSGEVVSPANYNAPGQIVIAGSVDGVSKAIALTKEDPQFKGAKCIPLQVSAPFHCQLMLPAQKEMAPLLTATRFNQPHCAIIANATAQLTEQQNALAGLLTDQIVQPVRWEQSMSQLRTLGVERVIEIGPGRVLAGLLKRIDRELPMANISTVEQMKEVLK